uniref:Class I SAM-dependent methyltransferase n=1 Tax=Acrobeloides nanus TaxID=290746 RepID=A0A914BXB6_9BILA
MAAIGFFAAKFWYNSFPNSFEVEEDSKIENKISQIEEKLSQIDDKIEKKTISLENIIKTQKVEENVELQNNEKKLFLQDCATSPTIKNYTWIEFKEKVLKNNEIYNTIKADPEKFDDQGWGGIHPFIGELIEEVAKDTNDNEIRIIEVGSWKGLSSRAAGVACKSFTAKTKKNCHILSIDTWLASSEHYEASLPEMKSNFYINDLFNTFLNNIKVKGLDDIVYPLRLPSSAAIHVLHCFKIDAHIIFIDADHDYKPILRDIETFYPLLKKNGIIYGDDNVDSWPGVIKAVHQYKDYKGDKIKFWQKGNYWLFKKLQEEPKFFGE